MEVLYLLLPISLLFVMAIGAAFWWAVFSGQFDDTDVAAHSILQDDDATAPQAGDVASHSATPQAGSHPLRK